MRGSRWAGFSYAARAKDGRGLGGRGRGRLGVGVQASRQTAEVRESERASERVIRKGGRAGVARCRERSGADDVEGEGALDVSP